MKCLECNLEMEAGLLVGEGGYWRPLSSVPGFMRPSEMMGATKVNAFKCPNCQKVELVAKAEAKD